MNQDISTMNEHNFNPFNIFSKFFYHFNGSSKVNELAYGPLNKSLFTQELELVAKCILRLPNKIHFEFKKSSHDLYAKVGNVDINLSQLFKRAHFSHIQLDKSDSDLYFKNLNHSHSTFNENFTKTPITFAEQAAIKGYSGVDYYKINSMLYGNTGILNQTGSNPKEVFLNAMMVASGLNKMMPDVSVQAPTYRGEHASPEEIAERIDLIKQGGGITDSKAFLSTSLDYDTANSFKSGSLIHFDGAYGKSIAEFSHFPSEKEFLLPPTQILWESHKIVNGTHVFQAKVVEPLIEGRDDATPSDLELFQQLTDWAHDQGIDTGFITPYLQSQLNPKLNPNRGEIERVNQDNPDSQDSVENEAIKPQSLGSTPLQLQDCLSFEKDPLLTGLENPKTFSVEPPVMSDFPSSPDSSDSHQNPPPSMTLALETPCFTTEMG